MQKMQQFVFVDPTSSRAHDTADRPVDTHGRPAPAGSTAVPIADTKVMVLPIAKEKGRRAWMRF